MKEEKKNIVVMKVESEQWSTATIMKSGRKLLLHI